MPSSVDLIIFGGTGDLAQRKLLPALYRAFYEKKLTPRFRIFCTCRSKYQMDNFLITVKESLIKHLQKNEFLEAHWDKFSSLISPTLLDITKSNDSWKALKSSLSNNKESERIFYFSIAPSFFSECCKQLTKYQLINSSSRVVVEKPLGYDRKSADSINAQIAEHFHESQIFRIDHYLGKETVQNLLVLRFSNLLFENMWDRNSIEHVQISISETVGLEGRAGFYNDVGALRDMVQNHLLQLLCLVAMEPFNKANGDNIRAEKLKVLESLRPIKAEDIKKYTARGQYVTGENHNMLVPGYLEELDKPSSFCETFVAISAYIDNWRWAGVPFYLRTGKRLKQRAAEIIIQFKSVAHSVYPQTAGNEQPNQLIIKLQPDEAIQLKLTSQNITNAEAELHPVMLDLNLTEDCESFYSDAYKRLLLDVISNNQSLFIHREEIDKAWAWIDPIIAGWQQSDYQPDLYRAGSWGPQSADELLARDGRYWFNPVINKHRVKNQ
jgi:glucose-6-phosphate 1-dehydrogenase